MRVLSVNCSLPQTVEINGKTVLTGINKTPVSSPIQVDQLGFEGDDQADKSVHGGPEQAVYCYSGNHYDHWQQYLNVDALPFGSFGENLTVSELDETTVCIGDVLQIGTSKLQVTKPRIPCFKLAHKLGSKTMVKDFLYSGFSGFYCRVLQTGVINRLDEIITITHDKQAIDVKTALILQKLDLSMLPAPKSLLKKALLIPSLTTELKQTFALRLDQLNMTK